MGFCQSKHKHKVFQREYLFDSNVSNKRDYMINDRKLIFSGVFKLSLTVTALFLHRWLNINNYLKQPLVKHKSFFYENEMVSGCR